MTEQAGISQKKSYIILLLGKIAIKPLAHETHLKQADRTYGSIQEEPCK